MAGCRAYGEERTAQSCVCCEPSLEDSLLQIGDSIALRVSVLGLEMALRSQVPRDAIGEEGDSPQQMVKAEETDPSESGLRNGQTFLPVHLLLKGNVFNISFFVIFL